jgi:metallo-beta-lactamase class B
MPVNAAMAISTVAAGGEARKLKPIRIHPTLYCKVMVPQLILFVAVLLLPLDQAARPLTPDPPISCFDCAEWNAPFEPFRIFGNTYYVGVAGLSAVLIASDRGLILLDGALPQSAPVIEANIRKLGFRTEDIRLIANSHAHFDHAGGIAALQRASGAIVAASEAGARAIVHGLPTPDDPQHALGPTVMRFPAVKTVRAVADGETLRAGDLAVTAHYTPGHTPGSTSWTWKSCEGPRCLDIVYADSLNAVSAPGFRFTGDAAGAGIVDRFRRSIATVAALACDIIISVHPGFTDIEGKLKKRTAQNGTNPFVDPRGCRAYAAQAGKRLDARVAEERKASR